MKTLMKTIAQQLDVTDFPFEIKNKDGNKIYHEDSKGHWAKSEYDSNGNEIYFENSYGYWEKHKYDSQGNEIYFETSDGAIKDNRPKAEIIIDGIIYKRIDQ